MTQAPITLIPMSLEHCGQAKKHLDYGPGGTNFGLVNRPEGQIAQARSVGSARQAVGQDQKAGSDGKQDRRIQANKLRTRKATGRARIGLNDALTITTHML